MRRYSRWLALLLALVCLPLCALAAPTSGSFTCYGEDLSAEQYAAVLDLLGTDLDNDTLISVSIEDEKALLNGLVDEDKMGSRSISSARVTLLDEGAGIHVTTHNIDWVTANMYASALATAGVENADIVVAAPVEVSGTAALAGIFKAYETASGQVLSDVAKALAGEEMLTLGNLADVIGTEEAEELIAMGKQYALENGLTDPEKARPYVEEAARQLGVSLSDSQIDTITSLLIRIVEQDLSAEEIAKQLNALNSSIQKFEQVKQGAATFFEKVKITFQSIGDWFMGLFGK